MQKSSNRRLAAKPRISLACLSVIAVFASVGMAHGQTNNWVWQAGGTNNWGTAGNWTLDPTGASGSFNYAIGADTVNTPPYAYTEISSGNYSGGSITSAVGLKISGGSLTLNDGPSSITGNLNIAGGTLNNYGFANLNVSSMTFSAGTLSGIGFSSVNVAGAFNNTAAAGVFLTNEAFLNLNGTSTWSNASSLINSAGGLGVGGTLTFNGAGFVYGGYFTNTGTVYMSAASATGGYYGIESSNFYNSGTIVDNGSDRVDLYADDVVNNYGTITTTAQGIGADGFRKSLNVDTAFYLFNYGTIQALGDNTSVTVEGDSSITNSSLLKADGMNALLDIETGGSLYNQGTISVSGKGATGQFDTFDVENSGTISIDNQASGVQAGPYFNNLSSGKLQITGGASFSKSAFGQFENAGLISLDNGSFEDHGLGVTNDASGKIVLANGSTMVQDSTGDGYTAWSNAGSIQIKTGSSLTVNNQLAQNTGSVSIDSTSSATFASGYTQTGSTSSTTVKGRLNAGGDIVLGTGVAGDGGLLTGNGTINGNVVNNSGTVAPGDPQILSIVGDYTQGAHGVLDLSIAGTAGAGLPHGFDQLDVTGNVFLDGTIDLSFLNGYAPVYGTSFDLLNFTGTFGMGSSLTIIDLTNPAQKFILTTSGGKLFATAATPEPSSVLVVGLGAAGLLLRRRSKMA
jgi:hypothetical protein